MRLIRLGITGCIGSGKSVVSAILQTSGIPVYDCDTEAKSLMENNSEMRAAITEAFGDGCYPDGLHLDRRHLAKIIFNDSAQLERINGIVHPMVRADFERWCNKQNCRIVAVESAILIEAGFADSVDRIIAVHADRETCIARACARSNSSRSEIESRMKKQMPVERMIAMSDFTICNDNSTPVLPQIQRLLEDLNQ